MDKFERIKDRIKGTELCKIGLGLICSQDEKGLKGYALQPISFQAYLKELHKSLSPLNYSLYCIPIHLLIVSSHISGEYM